MAIPGSVPISGFVAPTSELDTYPSHNAKYGLGGHRTVATIAERDAIPADRTEEGMTVYVVSEGKTYIYKSGGYEVEAGGAGAGISEVFATITDMNASVTTDRVEGEQVFVEEDTTVYAYNKALDQWDSFMVLDYYDKAAIDTMMLSAAVGLQYSLRDIPAGDDALTQLGAIVPATEGVLAILNDDAIYRWTKTSVDPDPETFAWQSFAVLSAGHTHDYDTLDNLPDLKKDALTELYGIQTVADEASVPVTEGVYYAEAEGTYWESDGAATANKTDWRLQTNLDKVVPDMAGNATKQLAVNATEDGVEWVDANTLKFTDVYKKIQTVQYQIAQASDIGTIAGMVEGELVYATLEDEIYEYNGAAWNLKTDFTLDIRNNLNLMDDVDTTGIANGSVLKWDDINSTWIVDTISTKISDVIKELYTISYEVADLAELNTLTGMGDGNLAYREDVDTFYEYNGSAWVARTNFKVDEEVPDTYTNAVATPEDVGGITAGSTFSAVSFSEMFDKLLYPYQAPAFSTFTISGLVAMEVGATLNGVQTFNWSTANAGNVVASTIEIEDVTGASILVTGSADDGTEDLDVGTISYNVPNTHVFRISGENTEGGTFTKTVSANWKWKWYYGESVATSLDEAGVEGLRVGGLLTSVAGTYSMAAGGYKYFAVPTSVSQPVTIKDAATNLDVDMQAPVTVSVTNGNGVVEDYKVYRTTNVLNGTINIVIGV